MVGPYFNLLFFVENVTHESSNKLNKKGPIQDLKYSVMLVIIQALKKDNV